MNDNQKAMVSFMFAENDNINFDCMINAQRGMDQLHNHFTHIIEAYIDINNLDSILFTTDDCINGIRICDDGSIKYYNVLGVEKDLSILIGEGCDVEKKVPISYFAYDSAIQIMRDIIGDVNKRILEKIKG